MRFVLIWMCAVFVSYSFAAVVVPDGTKDLPIFGKQTIFNAGTGDVKYVTGDEFGVANVSSPNLEIIKGNVKGVTGVHRTMYDSTLTTTAYIFGPVYGTAETLYYTETAVSIEVVSSSAQDAAAGTGARSVKITYINSTGDEAVLTVAPTGQTTKELSVKMIAINKMEVTIAGTGLTNAGNIVCHYRYSPVAAGVSTDKTKILNGIATGDGVSHSGVYTVPVDVDAYMESFIVTGAFTVNAEIVMWEKEFAGIKTKIEDLHFSAGGAAAGIDYPIVLKDRAQYFLTGVAAAASEASAHISLRTEDE